MSVDFNFTGEPPYVAPPFDEFNFHFSTPVDPPVVDSSIGIEVGIAWLSPEAIEQLIALGNQTSRVEQETALAWQSGPSLGIQLELSNQAGGSLQTLACIAWAGEDITAITRLGWKNTALLAVDVAAPWQANDTIEQQQVIAWDSPAATDSVHAIAWDGRAIGNQVAVAYQYHTSVGAEPAIQWGPHAPRWVCSTKYRPPKPGVITMRFDKDYQAVTSPLVLRFNSSPEYCYWDNGGGLIDAHPSLPSLDFKIPIEPQIRRSYLMQPQLSCIRMSDSLPVVLKSVSISKSRGQWASSGNLAFSSRIDAERAANELLKVSINGDDFYLLCEATSETRGFGQSRYSASCRGRFAELSAPYKKPVNYVNTTARSFMGMMGDIIDNMGWTLASAITDYNVPANAFSYAAKTPAEAVNMMANAIGAMLDIDDETKTITVIPQWSTVPWDVANAVPDVILHDGVILDFTEKRVIRTNANAVFVRGEQQGVAVKVKRTGTAGDEFAADVVDKLITDNQAGRMRGTVELAEAGNKVQNIIRTKVMADLPPMRPGMLIGVTAGASVFKSVCDAVTISASVNESTGAVTVNQNVTLLRNEVAA